MNAIAISLPLLLMPVLYAALVKLAALLFRRIKLSWKHALVFGVLAMVVGAIGWFANFATGRVVPAPLTALISVAVQLALGGWFFKERAYLVSGAPVGRVRGALIPLIAIGLILLLATMVMLVFPPVQPSIGRP